MKIKLGRNFDLILDTKKKKLEIITKDFNENFAVILDVKNAYKFSLVGWNKRVGEKKKNVAKKKPKKLTLFKK